MFLMVSFGFFLRFYGSRNLFDLDLFATSLSIAFVMPSKNITFVFDLKVSFEPKELERYSFFEKKTFLLPAFGIKIESFPKIPSLQFFLF
jgi:hypothetical protein